MTAIGYLIGVDGGGTNARARLSDAGGLVLGEGSGGPGNIRLGIATAWANIAAAIDGALAEAGLSQAIFAQTSIALGLAGIVDEADAAAIVSAGPAFRRAVAVSDAHIACLGAFAGRDGAILITGTGSAAHAVVDGIGQPVFGWGFEVDDKGSAADLGRSAIAAALEALDGLAFETALTREVRERIGGAAGAIVQWITAALPRDYGAIAPIVFAAARKDDPVGLSLVRRSAADLERMIARLREIGARRVCLMGGMAPHIAPWLSEEARDSLTFPEQDAIAGAFLLARRSMTEDPQDR